MQSLTINEKAAAMLKLVQAGIALVPRPYAGVAAECGMSEAEVVAALANFKSAGLIRRFGALLNHRHAGFTENALLAWDVRGLAADVVDRLGACAAGFEYISHCYLRKPAESGHCAGSAWPYQLYTMLHARNAGELCARTEAVYAALNAETSGKLQKPLVLRTLQEYKKSAMHYF